MDINSPDIVIRIEFKDKEDIKFVNNIEDIIYKNIDKYLNKSLFSRLFTKVSDDYIEINYFKD